MDKRTVLTVTAVVILAITLPYLVAALAGGPDQVFIGFLLNPLDGASYLAKLRQGWSGEWRFTLPFTAQPGDGAYLFMFYLFLGHLARWLHLPLVIMYHLARLLGAGLLLAALRQFCARMFAGRADLQRLAFWLCAVGSGMGWLVVFAGVTPADFWVAEAYPFLSMFANPHFPIGLALLLWIFILLIEPNARFRAPLLAGLGLLVSIIMPFGVVLALLVALAWAAWTWLETRRLEWLPVVSLGLLGGPFLAYQYWAALTDPILAGWNAQNLTPSPPLWDFLLSFSPALPLAVVGGVALYREKSSCARRLLLIWAVMGLALVYFPFSLQRRFLLGLYIPLAALAVYGLVALRERYNQRARGLVRLTFALAVPTNCLLLVIALFGILSRSPLLYASRDEVAALAWIEQQSAPRALLLAAPDTGRLIPGLTGRRVIYGHPYETVDASAEEQRVTSFFAQSATVQPDEELLARRGVAYIFYGPRERLLGGNPDFSALPLVFDHGDVQVYAVRGAR